MAEQKFQLDPTKYPPEYVPFITSFNKRFLKELKEISNAPQHSHASLAQLLGIILELQEEFARNVDAREIFKKYKPELNKILGINSPEASPEIQRKMTSAAEINKALRANDITANVKPAVYLLKAWLRAKAGPLPNQQLYAHTELVFQDFQKAQQAELAATCPITNGMVHQFNVSWALATLNVEKLQQFSKNKQELSSIERIDVSSIVGIYERNSPVATVKGFSYRAYIEDSNTSEFCQALLKGEFNNEKDFPSTENFFRNKNLSDLFNTQFINFNIDKQVTKQAAIAEAPWRDYYFAIHFLKYGYYKEAVEYIKKSALWKRYPSEGFAKLDKSLQSVLNFWSKVANKSWRDLRGKLYQIMLDYNRFGDKKKARQKLRNQMLERLIKIDQSQKSDSGKIAAVKKEILPMAVKLGGANLSRLQKFKDKDYKKSLSQLPLNILTLLVRYINLMEADIDALNEEDLQANTKVGEKLEDYNDKMGRNLARDCVKRKHKKWKKELEENKIYEFCKDYLTIDNPKSTALPYPLNPLLQLEMLIDSYREQVEKQDPSLDIPAEFRAGIDEQIKLLLLLADKLDFGVYFEKIRYQETADDLKRPSTVDIFKEFHKKGELPRETTFFKLDQLYDQEKYDSKVGAIDLKDMPKNIALTYYFLGLYFFSKKLPMLAAENFRKAWSYANRIDDLSIFDHYDQGVMKKLFAESREPQTQPSIFRLRRSASLMESSAIYKGCVSYVAELLATKAELKVKPVAPVQEQSQPQTALSLGSKSVDTQQESQERTEKDEEASAELKS